MAFNLSALKEYFGISDEYEDYYDEIEEEAYAGAPAVAVSNGGGQQQARTQSQESHYDRSSYASSTVAPQSVPTETVHANNYERSKIVSMNTNNNKVVANSRDEHERKKQEEVVNKIVVIEPRVQNECNDIATCILRKEIVIINFRVMDEYDARRVVDFVNGVLFALNGRFERIGDEMFICTPPNMEVEGAIAKSMVGSGRQRFDFQ